VGYKLSETPTNLSCHINPSSLIHREAVLSPSLQYSCRIYEHRVYILANPTRYNDGIESIDTKQQCFWNVSGGVIDSCKPYKRGKIIAFGGS
jgi:hypothetical protein